MTTADCDVVFVGGGYRTISFLAANPWLLNLRVQVIERSSSLGGGAFADYDCVSTSVSSRFVAAVSDEIVAGVTDKSRLRLLRREDATPLPLVDIAAAMEDIGTSVESRLSRNGRVLRHSNVDRVEVGEAGVLIRLTDGEQIHCRHAVIATGREERPHPALQAWYGKVLRSSEVLSVRRSESTTARLRAADGSVVIAGGSHSAVAALLRLMKLRSKCERQDLPIVMLRRSLARLHYASLGHAHSEWDDSAEAPIDPIADVCPATGQVNRDSGLRGTGRALYRRLAAGDLPGVSVEHAALRQSGSLLDKAGLIVQALGYHGRAPTIALPDGTVRAPDSPARLFNLADGTALIETRTVPMLSVLRVEPTPLASRDHGLYGQGLYDAMAERLRKLLAVPV